MQGLLSEYTSRLFRAVLASPVRDALAHGAHTFAQHRILRIGQGAAFTVHCPQLTQVFLCKCPRLIATNHQGYSCAGALLQEPSVADCGGTCTRRATQVGMFLRSLVQRAARAPSWVSSSGTRFAPPVGYEPDPQIRQTLTELYRQTLKMLEDIPASAAYRINAEKTINYRLKLVQETEDVMELENKLGFGHIEGVVVQAQNEIDLIPTLIEQKPWEAPADIKPVKIELID
ncbi:putative NADH dehydrogenase ubiquinone 1 alpha subcomplex subunit 5 [Porphyridium purpureum]|uniref:Putative NADH dehydrogenase ubiquinone 1 alpha subcomplex subunit 5 n=1 Tax=Porphyridium purpureum TaxID=35688 RepID=A0A5J4YS50_PORPP|nr:putative NADH dehydrogenase ubiquinone 1 alpha subcomplex subunit 5 [Porphyridium purpureum]|eukprot:POR8193..scf236_6